MRENHLQVFAPLQKTLQPRNPQSRPRGHMEERERSCIKLGIIATSVNSSFFLLFLLLQFFKDGENELSGGWLTGLGNIAVKQDYAWHLHFCG